MIRECRRSIEIVRDIFAKGFEARDQQAFKIVYCCRFSRSYFLRFVELIKIQTYRINLARVDLAVIDPSWIARNLELYCFVTRIVERLISRRRTASGRPRRAQKNRRKTRTSARADSVNLNASSAWKGKDLRTALAYSGTVRCQRYSHRRRQSQRTPLICGLRPNFASILAQSGSM